jgi:hypothetical protein
MTIYEKLPGWLKAALALGILLVGPVMLFSLWFAGTQGGIIAIISIIIYFITLYIVAVRRYIER